MFGKNSYNACSYILGRPETMVHRVDYICDYHLFIRCGDKVYMDVKKVGSIVIPFSELQKNKYWASYYDLSLMLTNDLHTVIDTKETSVSGGSNNYWAYEYKRYWRIDTATISGTQDSEIKEIVNGENNCYYKISPYDFENMNYSSQQELEIFKKMYVSRYEIRSGNFNSRYLYDLAFDYFDYRISLIEEEVEEFEDKYNLLNLVALNDKKGMNGDILMLIYNNLVSANAYDKYEYIIRELGKCSQLESVARILEA